MTSRAQKFWNFFARYFQKPMLALVRHQPTARIIADVNAMLVYKTPLGLKMTHETLHHDGQSAHVTTCRIGSEPTDGTLLYLHGGAFMIGSLRMYRHLVAALGAAANQRAVLLNHDRAPEHPFPTALNQATAAYRALASDPETGPITLIGDSAGGNMMFALLHRICTQNLPKPVAVVGLSPIVDLRVRGGSRKSNLMADPLIPGSWAEQGRDAYLAGHDPTDPEVSPLLGDFTGAPPCLLHVDEGEILYDDTIDMAARLREYAVEVEVFASKGRTHVWHLNVGRSPEADDDVAAIGAFIKGRVGITE